MILKGWTNPLPRYILLAIGESRLEVKEDPKGRFQYLVGEAESPSGFIVSFPEKPGIGGEQHIFMLKEIRELRT